MKVKKSLLIISALCVSFAISGCSSSYVSTDENPDVSANQAVSADEVKEKTNFEEDDNAFEYEELDNGFAFTDNADYFGYAFDGNEFLDRFVTSEEEISKIENDLNISLPKAHEVNFDDDYIFILWNSAITDVCKIRYISGIGIMKEEDEESGAVKDVYSIIYKESEEEEYIDESKGEFLVSYNVVKISKDNLPTKEMNFKIVCENN